LSEDWNQKFTELVRRGAGAPDQLTAAETGGADASESPPARPDRPDAATDPDQAADARRDAVATALVRVGFIAADHATPDNPAVEVLAELLPPEAEINLCLTCRDVSSSRPYTFTESTGQFPHRASFSTEEAHPTGWRGSPVSAQRHDFVVCTGDALCWTASRGLGVRYDRVTLYSVPLQDVLGATVRHRRKGIVDVWVDDGPTLSFRVEPNAADALQAEVEGAAQSQ
jgi:hypothetical protein